MPVRGDLREDAGALAEAWHRGVERCIAQVLLTQGLRFLYFLYAVGLCLAFATLLLYHSIIMAGNMTTNEHVRDYYVSKNPFDTTCTENYRQVFCAPFGADFEVDYMQSGGWSSSSTAQPKDIESQAPAKPPEPCKA